ncbi:hypothetical protein AE618_13195 [Bosea vaviloviae]|uniref:Uncharacterized protein n=1 Tax=Bosea vaviloviae TaxID=1526658 RepID=A0A0N0MC56_9HYPH|nr:hypothetical protein AE618_13195 [Bosea vaviloviae]
MRQIRNSGLVSDSLDGLLHGADALQFVDEQRDFLVRPAAIPFLIAIEVRRLPVIDPIGEPAGHW